MSDPTPASFFVIVSNAADGDLAVFRVDAPTGHIERVARHPAGEAVMPMALSADDSMLHAATRAAKRTIVTYSVDSGTGSLTRLRTTSIASSLAYLSLTPSGAWLLGASYGEHSVSLYRAADVHADAHVDPVHAIEGIEHAHSIVASADGRFAYVASLGSDTVSCYAIVERAADARLELAQKVRVEPGFGPRHLRFSPDGGKLYVSSEFRATVAVFARDGETGTLTERSVAPRATALAHLRDGRARPLAPGTAGAQVDPSTLIWAADIQITPNGRFVFVAERTTSRLIGYRVTDDGSLDYAGYTDTETQPRGFRIDPSGRFLVACGEQSTQVAVYAIDADSRALALLSRCEGGRGANWVEIIPQTQPAKRATSAEPTH
ncbi:beta-propeller fold lactonase family protein [Paraburkholderia sp. CNPSo 3157]|uniref:Beta-propeller fold lactonase family protein n=1 Tax=Paraburkholderia franconis TaxID=2654983 RepID=A0A7X1TGB7_9BURK|nr:beta-propeller fold lactonase family protein [Paraburkholderia franconis]MPW18223.1 beta-propeller fold lactonase family protein [Paraburkholderia franconis]